MATITDEMLLANLATYEADPMAKGMKARYDYLMPIPAEDRSAVEGPAHTLVNTCPGFRYSDGLYNATKTYRFSGVEGVRSEIERRR